MSDGLPSSSEERWLVLGARLRGLLPPDALRERAGGWRGTGPFARIALFVLGLLAAGLVAAVLGFGGANLALFAGVVALLAGEGLKRGKRLPLTFQNGNHLPQLPGQAICRAHSPNPIAIRAAIIASAILAGRIG